MELKDKESWEAGLKNNQDSYGGGVYKFAEKWANLMEKKLEEGKEFQDFAKETSHDADTDGITGFMYGAAVSVLSNCWEHGEELRLWHNLDTQIGNEGEKANKSGSVLNPALLNISAKGNR